MKYQLPKRNERLAGIILGNFPSFTAFSYVVGESESMVSKIINGWRRLTPCRRQKWAEVLNCDESDLK